MSHVLRCQESADRLDILLAFDESGEHHVCLSLDLQNFLSSPSRYKGPNLWSWIWTRYEYLKGL
jgi:hypothetical protein